MSWWLVAAINLIEAIVALAALVLLLFGIYLGIAAAGRYFGRSE